MIIGDNIRIGGEIMKLSVDVVMLNQAIAEKGLNPNTFSKMAGLPVATVYRICRGTHAVSPRVAKAVAEQLDLEFEKLFRIEVKQ